MGFSIAHQCREFEIPNSKLCVAGWLGAHLNSVDPVGLQSFQESFAISILTYISPVKRICTLLYFK